MTSQLCQTKNKKLRDEAAPLMKGFLDSKPGYLTQLSYNDQYGVWVSNLGVGVWCSTEVARWVADHVFGIKDASISGSYLHQGCRLQINWRKR